jgi:hypothetical protein
MSKKLKSELVLREVVKIVEIDPIQVADQTLWFRIDVTREIGAKKGRFTARVWRSEHHQLKDKADQVIVDSTHLFEEISGKSVKQVVKKTVREIEARFKPQQK